MHFHKKLFIYMALVFCPMASAQECVVLLHGLGKTSSSMHKLEEAITAQGYFVVNVDYPSKEKFIEELAEIALPAGISKCVKNKALPVNIVTHSLGGMLVRQYYAHHDISGLNRVIMLSPPNNGSEVLDILIHIPYFGEYYGFPSLQLGTDKKDFPKRLGAVNFTLGVIAGTESTHYFYSLILPGVDDGRVSVASARVEGMKAFIAVAAPHELIMENKLTIFQTIHFLKYGDFSAAKLKWLATTH